MVVHSPSGLNTTWYRIPSAELGRGLSRDPLGEQGGLNLYRYVANNPIGFLDPSGLCGDSWTILGGWSGPDSWVLNNDQGAEPSSGLETFKTTIDNVGDASDIIALSPAGKWSVGVNYETGAFSFYDHFVTGNQYFAADRIGTYAEGLSKGMAAAKVLTDFYQGEETGQWTEPSQDISLTAIAFYSGTGPGVVIGIGWEWGKDDLNTDVQGIFQYITDLENGVDPATDWTLGNPLPDHCK
jgi:RHS repeat-associated protein